MDPITMALLSAGTSALGSIGGGMLSNSGDSETKMQRKQRKLIDDLLASLKGNGSYNDLFQSDYDSFQKSYVDPAKSMFKNQIAPQIQQSYIASGQQRGTGLDDTLARAGVDMDQLLNQEYMKYQQGIMDRKQNTINSILGSGSGAQNPQSFASSAGQATGGYLASQGFRESSNDILDLLSNRNQQRKGFAS